VEDKKNKKRKDINFVGYTYKKDVEEQKSNLVKALNESLYTDLSHSQNITASAGNSDMSTPQQKMIDSS
jgi:hypothetical protein